MQSVHKTLVALNFSVKIVNRLRLEIFLRQSLGFRKLFLSLQRIVDVSLLCRHIDKSKRYALLAQMKPEKFQFVAQESVAVRAYSVGCLYHSVQQGFSQDLI